MGDFHRCIELILAEEGGYVLHPDDPGGATKFGLSQRAYPQLDISALTLDEAKALYHRDYWTPIQGDTLPDGLDLLVFDGAVNQGPRTAIQLLQEAARVPIDGVLGPVTLLAAARQMPGIRLEFTARRAWRYELNPREPVFGLGWFRRLLRLYTTALQGTVAS